MPTVAIIGLGYVGLPLAVRAAEQGYQTLGIDVNEQLVTLVKNRTSPFANDTRLAAALATIPPAALEATTSFERLKDADIIVICVPTPTDDNIPDLTYVHNATREVAQHLRKGQLVVLESTVNPGVTRDDMLPMLEKSGLACGTDFHLAYCPERIDPGNPTYHVGNLNRVVGGITPECTKHTVQFYKSIIDAKVLPLGSPEEAEFVKSWENSHRNVLIALANQAAIICDAMGMDINNVLEGLQSKIDQLGLRLAKPGIGPGGHCIPEDIHYVIRKARQNNLDTGFLDAAAHLNDKMPRYAVNQLSDMVKASGKRLRDMRVALLGLAYKENIEDARRSPAIDVAHLLVQRAGSVVMHDPFVDLPRLHIRGAEHTNDIDAALQGADAVFIATAHDVYKDVPKLLQRHGIRYVLDGRNSIHSISDPSIVYQGIGRGNNTVHVGERNA